MVGLGDALGGLGGGPGLDETGGNPKSRRSTEIGAGVGAGAVGANLFCTALDLVLLGDEADLDVADAVASIPERCFLACALNLAASDGARTTFRWGGASSSLSSEEESSDDC